MVGTGKGRLLDDIALGDKRVLFDGDAEEEWIGTKLCGVLFCTLFICGDTLYEILPVVSDGMTSVQRQSPHSFRLVIYLFKSVSIWFCGCKREPITLIDLFIYQINCCDYLLYRSSQVNGCCQFLIEYRLVVIILLKGHRRIVQ